VRGLMCGTFAVLGCVLLTADDHFAQLCGIILIAVGISYFSDEEDL